MSKNNLLNFISKFRKMKVMFCMQVTRHLCIRKVFSLKSLVSCSIQLSTHLPFITLHLCWLTAHCFIVNVFSFWIYMKCLLLTSSKCQSISLIKSSRQWYSYVFYQIYLYHFLLLKNASFFGILKVFNKNYLY